MGTMPPVLICIAGADTEVASGTGVAPAAPTGVACCVSPEDTTIVANKVGVGASPPVSAAVVAPASGAVVAAVPPQAMTNARATNKGMRMIDLGVQNCLCMINLSPFYNGIMIYDPETDDPDDIVCDICTSWSVSEDGKTFVYNIHPEARWSDGVPVTGGTHEVDVEPVPVVL